MSFLGRAEAMLRRVRADHLSALYKYLAIESGETIDLRATMGQATVESDGQTIIYADAVDFIIDRWASDHKAKEPKPGDLLVCVSTYPDYEDQGLAESSYSEFVAMAVEGDWPFVEYEVLSLAGQRCWQPHGQDGLSWRVHAKVVRRHHG